MGQLTFLRPADIDKEAPDAHIGRRITTIRRMLMKRLVAVAVVALFGLAPAVGAACEYNQAMDNQAMAASTPAEQLGPRACTGGEQGGAGCRQGADCQSAKAGGRQGQGPGPGQGGFGRKPLGNSFRYRRKARLARAFFMPASGI
jgi:hypothetical protein